MKNLIFTFNTMIEYLYSKLEGICISGFYLAILTSIYYFINIFFKFPKHTGTILITIISILVLLAFIGYFNEIYDFYFKSTSDKFDIDISFFNKLKTNKPKYTFLKLLVVIVSFFGTLALSLATIFIIFSIYVIYLLIIIFIIGTIFSFISKFF